MNEQLQKELAAWLAKLRETADAGASFAMEQAPLIVQEKVLYGRIAESLMFASAVLVLIALATVSWKSYQHANEDNDFPREMIAIFAGVGAFGAGIYAAEQLRAVVQVWVAPRIYIIEWLSGLV